MKDPSGVASVGRRTGAMAFGGRKVALVVETALVSGREILKGVGRFLREGHGWTVTHEPRNLFDPLPRWLGSWQGDGIIARVASTEMAAALRRTGLPVVDVLGMMSDSGFPLVHVNDSAIAGLAVQHLQSLGLRKFGFYGFEEENWSVQRRVAMAVALKERGDGVSVLEIPRRGRLGRAGQKRLMGWLQRLPLPVGILACNDDMANELLQMCRRIGRAVPDEVAVIGVDDDDALCSIASPPLSSIRAGHAEVGYQAAHLLQKLMRGAPLPKGPLWISPGEVLARQSSDLTRVADREVQRALRCIRERACGGLTIDELADATGVSRSVLQRRFRRWLGKTAHQAIRDHQMQVATGLLADTTMSLAEVAGTVGFPHAEYFSMVFKKATGATPKRYRVAMMRRETGFMNDRIS